MIGERTRKSKVRGYIRQYLLPIRHYQHEQTTDIDDPSKIHPNIIKFIHKLRRLFPLDHRDIKESDAVQAIKEEWQFTDQLDDRTKKQFRTFHYMTQHKMGSSQYASACYNLASSHYSAMSFPASPEKGLVLALNTKLDSHLLRILELAYLCFRSNSSWLVGTKPKKAQLADVATRITLLNKNIFFALSLKLLQSQVLTEQLQTPVNLDKLILEMMFIVTFIDDSYFTQLIRNTIYGGLSLLNNSIWWNDHMNYVWSWTIIDLCGLLSLIFALRGWSLFKISPF